MRTVTLPNGDAVPQLGLGTWHMGERGGDHAAEARALAHGLERGIALVDTAEMYGAGGAEQVIARALKGRRDRPYIVSKVYPYNATRDGVVVACDRSLKRLGVERIDLYLLHWRGATPFAKTIEGFERLIGAGKIGAWGVSNLDAREMEEVWAAPGGDGCQTDQALYNLDKRWAEATLLPTLRSRKTPLMAYTPLGQGALARAPGLRRVATEAGLDPIQLALAWTLRLPDVFAVPKSARPERIDGFLAAAELTLSDDVLAALDAAFPPPAPDAELEML